MQRYMARVVSSHARKLNSQIFQHETFVIYGEQKVTPDDLQALLKATVITGS